MTKMKELMEQKGISAAELARETGVKVDRIRKFLKGSLARGLKDEEIRAIAKCLDIAGYEYEMYFDKMPFETQMRFKKALKDQIEFIIAYHTKFRNVYFWTPGANMRAREKNSNTKDCEFVYEGDVYYYEGCYEEHYSYCEYTSTFMINDDYKDVRLFKKLLKKIEADFSQAA